MSTEVSMSAIKVSYTENWDCEGYHTTQNIKIPKEVVLQFNDYAMTCVKKAQANKGNCCYGEQQIALYVRPVKDMLEKGRCLHLTELQLLYKFLQMQGYDCKRIKTNRNTMLYMESVNKPKMSLTMASVKRCLRGAENYYTVYKENGVIYLRIAWKMHENPVAWRNLTHYFDLEKQPQTPQSRSLGCDVYIVKSAKY